MTTALSRVYQHAGAPTLPRVVDCVLSGQHELRVTIRSGANLGASLREALARYPHGGGVGRICAGTARGLRYHMLVTTADEKRPFGYGAPVDEAREVDLIGGAITIGCTADGAPLLHCHAGFSDPAGGLHGGHLILDHTWAGEEPVVVRLCLFAHGGYVTREDAETHFNLLHPVAGEPS
ncbi:hypothetical protein PTE30175_01010 [Pandoraea terrae]|uniref:PPC domain-containing protein n=1 Tax=Pandoraea terrae TaxID=1537710 RepID=A0A5E4SXS1_9BURK|nr:hypothetical protein [Pandoraea terrae]VVD79971.1 hypothetical protein PTE30175_01010 [Pandoraea terrae]